MTPELFHYTCSHAALHIGAPRGVLLPNAHALLPRPLVWLTDMAEPDREALGLTSHTLRCDRTEVRYRVIEPEHAVAWTDYALGRHLPRAAVSELTFGRKPRRWWVSEQPVKVRRP